MKKIFLFGALTLLVNSFATPSLNRSDWEVITSKDAINNSSPVERIQFDSKNTLYYSAGTNLFQLEPHNAPNFNKMKVDISATNTTSVYGWNIINDTLWIGGDKGKIWFRTPAILAASFP